MGVGALDCAIALDIERESYLRLERAPYKFNNGEMAILADTIGIRPNQFWFPPPPAGEVRVSLDDLADENPHVDRDLMVRTLRGMVGK